jgi:hypothetical protein
MYRTKRFAYLSDAWCAGGELKILLPRRAQEVGCRLFIGEHPPVTRAPGTDLLLVHRPW